MFCTLCGAKNNDDSRFCNICGAALETEVTEQPQPEPVFEAEPEPVVDSEPVFEPDPEPIPEQPAVVEPEPEPVVENTPELITEPELEPEPIAEPIPEQVPPAQYQPLQYQPPQYQPPQQQPPQYQPPQYYPPQNQPPQYYPPQYQPPQYQPPQYQPPQYQPPQYQPPQQTGPVLTSEGRDKVRQALRKLLGSPLLLIAAILMTLNLLATLAASFMGSNMSNLYGLLAQFGFSSREIREIMSSMQGATILGTIVGLIPGVLICIGLWITYATGKSKRNMTFSTAGMNMILVMQIIAFSFICLGVLIASIALLVGLVATMEPAMLVIMLIFAGLVTVLIMYYVFLFNTMSRMKNTMRTLVPNGKISVFVAVIAIIGAAVNLLSVAVVAMGAMSGIDVSSIIVLLISALPTLLSAVISILMSICLLTWRSKMRALEQELMPKFIPPYM